MSPKADGETPAGTNRSPEPEEERRRRRARVFGDVLPDSTRDERGHGSSEDGGTDEWLRRQVPPHHG